MEAQTSTGLTEREAYQQFCYFLIGRLGRTPPEELLWHYTSFAGLEGILSSGEVFATQHSGLNDYLEYQHLAKLVRTRVVEKLAAGQREPLATFYGAAAKMLDDIDISAMGHFVTCFSEKRDDIGQWRGYGGGECGYAVGFRFADLEAAVRARDGLILPMCYRKDLHDWVVDEIIEKAEYFYGHGLTAPGRTPEGWAMEFISVFVEILDPVISIVKDPSFEPEAEYRTVLKLREEDREKLEFRQKKTLLARYLRLDLRRPGTKRVPIAEVMVGPGPSQRATEVGVGDLLAKFKHAGVKISKSKVPYRTP